MKNNLRTYYIIEQTEEPSIYTLSFYTSNGDNFEFGMLGHVSILQRLQYFEFNINLN